VLAGQEKVKMSEENRSPVHHTRKFVELMGGPPWGFRIQGGRDTNIPLKIARVCCHPVLNCYKVAFEITRSSIQSRLF